MRKFWLSLIVLTILFAGISFGQGPLTNALNLMVRTDSNGSLYVYGVTAGAQGPLTNFGNIRLRTYNGGDLGVVVNGGTITPTNITATGAILSGYGTAAAVGLGIDVNTGLYGSAGVLRISCGNAANCAVFTNGAASVTGTFSAGNLATGKFTTYNNIATAGYGAPGIYGYGDVVAAVNTGTASIATYTVGASDGTFEVSCNILITVSTNHTFSCDATYTDEGSTTRTMVFPVEQLAGTFATSGLMTNITGAGPYESPAMTIRAKASTAITIRTSAGGTFTTVTYNARGIIKQVG